MAKDLVLAQIQVKSLAPDNMLQALVAFESVPPSSSSRAGSPSPATRPVCALRRGAACRRPGVQADPSTGWARWSVEKAV